jgi:hypothetical protein
MMWVFLALLSRLAWAGCNASDQVLSRAHKKYQARSAFFLQMCVFAVCRFHDDLFG